MQAQQITVKTVFLNPDKKNDKVIDTQGVSWYVPHNLANQLQVGTSATVGYEVNNFNGGNLNMVKRVDLNGALPVQDRNADKPQLGSPSYPAPSPAPYQNGNGNGRGLTQAKEIFITGIVGRAMGSGQFTSTDIKLLALAAADAWDALNH